MATNAGPDFQTGLWPLIATDAVEQVGDCWG